MNTFAVSDKVKPGVENIRGLNFAVVKLTTVQLNRLPLYHKISKTGMICFARPVLTQDLYIVQKIIFNNMLTEQAFYSIDEYYKSTSK
jgi:hypothetical protein